MKEKPIEDKPTPPTVQPPNSRVPETVSETAPEAVEKISASESAPESAERPAVLLEQPQSGHADTLVSPPGPLSPGPLSPGPLSNDTPDDAPNDTQSSVKAISESLRRIRQSSGPLIIEAAKQKQDRFTEIITQAVESMRPGEDAANPAEANKQSIPHGAPPAGASVSLQSRAQAVAQTAANAVAAAAQSAVRKTSDAFVSVTASASGASGSSSTGATAIGSRANTGTLANASQFPTNGPSRVLVQASGLKPQSFGSKFRAGIFLLVFLVLVGIYFIFRDNLLGSRPPADPDRNLVRAEEQSEQFLKYGEREREQGNYEPAIENFRRALELTPNNQNARFQLAQTFLNSGQQDEALKAYQSLLRIAPEHLEARLQLAEIHRARGNWAAAYQEYQRIIAFDQNSGQAQVALETIEKHEAEDAAHSGALAAERNARKRRAQKKNSPALPAALTANVRVPLLTQRTTTANNIRPPSLGAASAEEKPDPRAVADMHKKLGVRYLNIREYRAAINEFLSALRLTPDDKDLYYFIGSSYNGLNQPAFAHDYYRRVDSGPYVGPAQSGAKLTEKAAREDLRRREQMKNEAKADASANKSAKSAANSLEE